MHAEKETAGPSSANKSKRDHQSKMRTPEGGRYKTFGDAL
jgi:hypothetical protein